MVLRERWEAVEDMLLSEFAVKSKNSKGREHKEEKCTIRTDFQRDRDRILHSKAFRRMKHKTQVYISPEGDHYRTRLTHTLEVSQIARTISRALFLNEDLTEAIALGHDLGHTPFGHDGEYALNHLSKYGFEHCKQSIRVVERLEKDGKGLNLTWEVKNGILNHRTAGHPETMEGKVVQLSDKIAYINHDIDDSIRAGVLLSSDIPKHIIDLVGDKSSKRINSMILDTIKNSHGINDIKMSTDMREALKNLRMFMFENVYNSKKIKLEKRKVDNIITKLFDYYIKNPYEMDKEFVKLMKEGDDVEIIVCDFIACMTDRFSITRYKQLFIPSSWNVY